MKINWLTIGDSLMYKRFMMAYRSLVRVLIHKNVNKYLNFKDVDASLVYNEACLFDFKENDVFRQYMS